MHFLFELGRQPMISLQELESVLSFFGIEYTILSFQNNHGVVETKTPFSSEKLMNRLGGTVKIARLIQKETDPENIANAIEDLQLDGKIQFSISGNNAKEIALETKKILKSNGRSVRYIEAKNTATILHNSLIQKKGDFTLHKEGLFLTESIQPIEDWGERDFGRPGRDSKSGMLPPKLARILINIASKNIVNENTIANTTILDPFCGSGTVIMESILLGYEHVLGSDISEKAVENTKINTDWILEQSEKTKPKIFKIMQMDSRKIANIIKPETIDIIATEPFLGKPLTGKETRDIILSNARELKSLYIETFKSFSKILKKNSVVVFLIPRFKHKQDFITIDCKKEIEHLGFEVISLSESVPYLLYSRPDQLVAREIWKFRKK